MKKGLFILAVASMALMGSCKSSKKGAWTDGDKKSFTKDCEAEIVKVKDTPDGKTIESMGVKIEDLAQKACDCAIKKIESNYENLKEADKDSKGTKAIGTECGAEAMKELMKK
ncbi:hypothetical protein AD998_16390 [bacterium 336/3]|nr:hypothetical protein AD998_16390 [bacterium 336/3]